jgi:hypothetical protein
VIDTSFSSFPEIISNARDRELVLFGAGTISEKTIRHLVKEPVYIADNAPNSWGAEELGLTISNPNKLEQGKRPYVIICTTSYIEVAEQLQSMGFKPGTDFAVSPILNDLRIISELENCKTHLLFASGNAAGATAEFGGGIYELTLDGSWEYRKVIDGICHGLIKFQDNFICIDDHRGIAEFDRDFKIIRSRELPQNSRGHGVVYSEERKQFFVVASYSDSILVLDDDFKVVDTIKISNKFDLYGQHCHHCNDIAIFGNSIYVSMFSITGNWRRDVFDGVVMEYDIDTKEPIGPVVSDLWMPHSVMFIGENLLVLDSLRGQLKKNNAMAVGEFPGFTRGIAYDGQYFYIGQSRNRNYSKYLGTSKNISIDTSIIVFDEATKVSRSLQLPYQLSEIHSIVIVPS